MPSVKSSSKNKFNGRTKRQTKVKAAKMREAKKRKAENADVSGEVHPVVSDGERECEGDACVFPPNATNNDYLSGSASKLHRFRNERDFENNENNADRQQRSWLFTECGQLSELFSDLHCPVCEDGSLTVSAGTSMGFARELTLSCKECPYEKSTYSSPRLNNQNNRQNVPFEVNKQMVVFTHEVGMGFSSLQKLCTVFGMPSINKKSFHRLDRQVNDDISNVCQSTLDETVNITKAVYQETFPNGPPQREPEDDNPADEPEWEINDGIPWVDVSFDGTWMKRGFSSRHGVGVVIDILTGYVLDFEILSTYCHVCEMNKGKLEEMPDDEQEAWRQVHEPDCSINHDGSAKSMEKEAAIRLWRRSVQRHNLRYRTMLSDGDSTAFTALRTDQPYGPTRLVTKLECVNHCHKRMGTALRKKAKEAKLGGRGNGRLTIDKCTRLQNYYRGAVLDNLGDTEAMNFAIWASLFHCTSTDEDPHHTRCPQGATSWCFYNAAIARGEQPPAHVDHVGTAISRDVFQAIVPIYRRMSSAVLLKRIAHGKTQNTNESLNNLIWVHCPKEIFVGACRLKAAVSEAVAKFNRGNCHVAQLLDFMNIPASDITLAHIEAMDKLRVQKAEKASSAAAIRQRRARREQWQHDVADREDNEGETYGPGLLADL